MINISKPFVAWVTRLQRNEFEKATLTLTCYYVISTAIILFVSSLAVVTLFTPPDNEHHDVVLHSESLTTEATPEEARDGDALTEILTWDGREFREHLPSVLLFVDVFILFAVSGISYFFARQTLLPIKYTHERQRQFMGDVAHELRTPLSVMRSGADTMLRREHSAEAYRDFITDVQTETRRLTRLSSQLLQFLRSGTTAENEFTKQNVSELLQKALNHFTAYATDHGVKLVTHITPDITATIDADGFAQIAQNLLKNAVDYNETDGSVTVALKETDTSFLFSVTDTGLGIAKEKQASIFGRFTKLDNARQHGEDTGAGLGLAIVNSIVARHRGSIAIDSIVGEGTTFTVILPKQPS